MDKREDILLGATRVFMSYGIKSVTMDDLARELGISKKTIYQFFKDKNELIETLLDEKLNQDQGTCDQMRMDSVNAIDALYKVISMIATNMSQIHPSVFYDLQKYHPGAMKKIDAHQQDFVSEMIKGNIVRGRTEGVYREDFDVEVVAQIYIRVVDSIVRREKITSESLNFSELFKEAIHFMITGMSTPKGIEFLNKHILHA